MDKLAAYEMLLEDHPLWTKEAIAYAPAVIGTGVGALGGAGLGYLSGDTDEEKATRMVQGAAAGGLLGYTGGRVYGIAKRHHREMGSMRKQHQAKMDQIRRQEASDLARHEAEMKRIKADSARYKEISKKLKEKTRRGELSIEDLLKGLK
jgi:hypothetical protein